MLIISGGLYDEYSALALDITMSHYFYFNLTHKSKIVLLVFYRTAKGSIKSFNV